MNAFHVCRLVTRRALVGGADHRPRTFVISMKYLCAAALPHKRFILPSSFLFTDGSGDALEASHWQIDLISLQPDSSMVADLK